MISSFTKEIILDYLEENGKSPVTEKALNPRLPVRSSLKPQLALKKEIEAFVEANKELLGTQGEKGTSFGEEKGERSECDEEMEFVE